MSLAQLIPIALNVSMGLVVLALGLHAHPRDAAYLLLRPGLLLRSILSMNVIMVAFAALLVAVLRLQPFIEIAIVALALSPVPPFLPKSQTKAGGSTSYVVALLLGAAVGSIIIVPFGIHAIGRIYGLTTAVPLRTVVPIVAITVILPLVLGMIVNRAEPALAARLAGPVSKLGMALLVVAFLPLLIADLPLIVAVVGDGTLAILALFTLVGVGVGHLLGGPDADDRSVLALATGTRHPGVALAIAAMTFPQVKAVAAVVFWHLVVAVIVTVPYVKRRNRIHAARHTPAPVFPGGHAARGTS
jgi:bile acid:Na+ symporter, BASS family